MTNETIGHYASHPSVGWRIPNESKLTICSTCGATYEKTRTHKCEDYPVKCFPTVQFSTGAQPSDLELKIRKEVLDAVEEMMDKLHSPEVSITRMKSLTYTIKDRLNLLWGE